MLPSKQDNDSLKLLTMPIVNDIDEVMSMQISGFNAELSALVIRIEEIRSRSVDLTYVTELSQLYVFREQLLEDSFRASVEAVRIAERRLELLSSLDERARVLIELAKHRLEKAASVATLDLLQSGLTQQRAEELTGETPEVIEAIKILRTVRALPARFRSGVNCCPELIAAFMDELGEKLQRWANDFVGFSCPA